MSVKKTGLKTLFNAKIEVGEMLGEGAQGTVYRILCNGEPKAMKIFKPDALADPKAFYENLVNNVKRGSPSETFLWIQDVIEPYQSKAGNTTFGYIMDLIPDGFKELNLFFNKKMAFPSFRTAVDTALQITSAFRILHSIGYSYQDLSGGNFCVDPKSGKVLICDNDNAAPNGMHTGILGTPRFMAPEIVRGEAMPSTNTDRFSLAVVLFMILTNSHPLEGTRYLVPCLTPEVEQTIYGTEPIFILDPADKRNAPIRGIHKNIGMIWPSLPDYLRDAFTRAFSGDLLHTPDLRLTEQEWEELLIRFRSDILPCPCGSETFTWNYSAPVCEDCKRSLPPAPMLELGGCSYDMPLTPGAIVFRSQFGTANINVAAEAVLRVVVNSRNLYLHNISDKMLECITPSGKTVPVSPGEPVPVKKGLALRLDSSPEKRVKIL